MVPSGFNENVKIGDEVYFLRENETTSEILKGKITRIIFKKKDKENVYFKIKVVGSIDEVVERKQGDFYKFQNELINDLKK